MIHSSHLHQLLYEIWIISGCSIESSLIIQQNRTSIYKYRVILIYQRMIMNLEMCWFKPTSFSAMKIIKYKLHSVHKSIQCIDSSIKLNFSQKVSPYSQTAFLSWCSSRCSLTQNGVCWNSFTFDITCKTGRQCWVCVKHLHRWTSVQNFWICPQIHT